MSFYGATYQVTGPLLLQGNQITPVETESSSLDKWSGMNNNSDDTVSKLSCPFAAHHPVALLVAFCLTPSRLHKISSFLVAWASVTAWHWHYEVSSLAHLRAHRLLVALYLRMAAASSSGTSSLAMMMVGEGIVADPEELGEPALKVAKLDTVCGICSRRPE
eukprot:1358329-Amphidinium_carterae.1